MSFIRNAREAATGPGSRVRWIRLSIALAAILALSFGLAYGFQSLISHFNLPDYAWLAYLTVFGISLVSNLTILAPVPFAVSIMISAASEWNPFLVALAASIGGTIGELSGYYAGRLERKIALPDSLVGYNRVEAWVRRWGAWAVFVLAIQPIIPFDIAGLVAGAARMPLYQFLPALWIGKFPKYLLLAYAGASLIHHLPFLAP